jgi:hypothetical protein
MEFHQESHYQQNNEDQPYANINGMFVRQDDSPQQQINEQSITQDLEKNRECKYNNST